MNPLAAKAAPPPPSLKGLVVLNTRPRAQQAGLTAAIEAAGGRVVALPLLKIVPLADHESTAVIQRQVECLARFDLLVFVSSNAAEIGARWLRQRWPQLPAGLTMVGVGPVTGAVLRESLGLPRQEGSTGKAHTPCQIITATEGMGTSAVLELPEMATAQVKGRRVAIFRGRGGRELLADTLRQRGAQVEYVEIYRRQPLHYKAGEVATILEREGVNGVIITSVESLHCLVAALGSASNIIKDARTEPTSLIPLVVPSARVETSAREAGFRQVVNANGSDRQSLLAGLAELVTSNPLIPTIDMQTQVPHSERAEKKRP